MTQPTTLWNEETILEHLKQVVQEKLNMPPEQIAEIGPDAPLMDTLKLDSLGQVILVTTIEEDFGYTFEREDWQTLQTVGDLVKMIAVHATTRGPEA
jgi:acyl carrier protein